MRRGRSLDRLVPLGLLLAATLLTCGLCELALRLGGWNIVRLQSEWILTNPWVVLDPDLIVVRRRLLGPSLVAPAPSPVILTIGDSYTEGFPVPPDRAYPAELGRILARRGIAATVRNAGMGDTGPDQQLRLLQDRLLPKLRPAVVVWQLYANDVWDNVVKAVYRLDGDHLEPVSGARHWITLRQHLFEWTPLPTAVKQQSRVFRLVLHAFEPRIRPGLEDAAIVATLPKLAHELDVFERLARTYGFTPYLLLVPPQSFYLRARDPAFEGDWYGAAHARLVTLVGDRPELIDGFLGTSNADRFFDTSRDPAEIGHRHLNERGYARLALLVARRLWHDRVLQ